MNAPVVALPGLSASWRSARLATTALGLGLLALLLLFHDEAHAALKTWIASTAYNHCFLVIPIAAYLLWDRRATLAGLTPRPLPAAALLGIPIAAVWLAAERLGIMEGRQLAALSFAELLVFAALGWQAWRLVSGPLLYLYFLVPFGTILTPKLQDLTTVFTRHGLDLLGIPAFIDGYTIEIPEGVFYIAEACAGLRFLIASVAFGCLYALIMYRSPVRRALFVVVSIVVPIIANGFRALGIVVLGHVLGSAQAAATDHVLYGWIFFSLVILLLIALGLPFREDSDLPGGAAWPVPRVGRRQTRLALAACAAVIAVSAIPPAVAAGLNLRAVAPGGPPPRLDPGALCRSLPGAQIPAIGTPGTLTSQRITCGDASFDVTIEVFSRYTTAGPVMAERHRLARMPDMEDTVEDWLAGNTRQPSHVWRILRSSRPVMARAVGVWVAGKPMLIGLAARLHLAWTSLAGARIPPVLVTVSPAVNWDRLTPAERRTAEAGLDDFLLSHPGLVPTVTSPY